MKKYRLEVFDQQSKRLAKAVMPLANPRDADVVIFAASQVLRSRWRAAKTSAEVVEPGMSIEVWSLGVHPSIRLFHHRVQAKDVQPAVPAETSPAPR